MEINNATYLGSYPTLAKCPAPGLPEFAFIGRSNVGKSSLINMLCNRSGMAHVSKKPGKTQAINFFSVDDSWFIVDLPGYGYARRSKGLIRSFGKMITDYLLKRETLFCAFILIDSNVPPQQNDIDFINWLGENRVPFVIAYTKSDRMSTPELEKNIRAIREELLKTWNELPQEFITSSADRSGREEILAFLGKWLKE